MKRELNKEEIKFLNFIDNIKLDIEKQNKEMKITKLLNFKGCYKDKKALKRNSCKASWLDVKLYIIKKYKLDFFKGDDTNLLIGAKVGIWKKRGVNKITLLKFQMFYLKIK